MTQEGLAYELGSWFFWMLIMTGAGFAGWKIYQSLLKKKPEPKNLPLK